MHTPLCRHATGEPVELAAQAVKLGLPEIGFSEHNPMIRDYYDDWHMLRSDLDAYVEKVAQARREYPGLTIKLALAGNRFHSRPGAMDPRPGGAASVGLPDRRGALRFRLVGFR